MQRIEKQATRGSAFDDHAGIESTLEEYEKALNAADIDRVLALFSEDAVFLAPNSPSAVGREAIAQAYTSIFRAVSFETELTVKEISVIAEGWAVVRTESNGFVTVNAIQERVSDANHELFVFNKWYDGRWQIARYAFASLLPARN